VPFPLPHSFLNHSFLSDFLLADILFIGLPGSNSKASRPLLTGIKNNVFATSERLEYNTVFTNFFFVQETSREAHREDSPLIGCS
jgi:hypothetical protein